MLTLQYWVVDEDNRHRSGMYYKHPALHQQYISLNAAKAAAEDIADEHMQRTRQAIAKHNAVQPPEAVNKAGWRAEERHACRVEARLAGVQQEWTMETTPRGNESDNWRLEVVPQVELRHRWFPIVKKVVLSETGETDSDHVTYSLGEPTTEDDWEMPIHRGGGPAISPLTVKVVCRSLKFCVNKTALRDWVKTADEQATKC